VVAIGDGFTVASRDENTRDARIVFLIMKEMNKPSGRRERKNIILPC